MKYKRLFNSEINKYEVYLTSDEAQTDDEIRQGVPIIYKEFDLPEILNYINDRLTLNITRSQTPPTVEIVADIWKLAILKVYQLKTFIED